MLAAWLGFWLYWQTEVDVSPWSPRNTLAFLLLRYGATNPGLLLVKLALLLATSGLLIVAWRPRSSLSRALAQGFRWVARRRPLAALVVGLFAVVGSVGLSYQQLPLPRGHDEFAYLLGADTFAHGRATNPTHPLWVHFESFHIIQQPTYAPKYPPGQALFLAAGQVIGGHPAVGVWLSLGLACVAVYWMLLAWVPRRWAFQGALLGTTCLVLGRDAPGDFLGYWGQTYWGGAVATIGGALVFGALRRVIRRPAISSSMILGLGLAVMANSRPFEGLVVSLPVLAALFVWLVGRNRPPVSIALTRVVLPLALVLVAAGSAMGYYNYRVTGNPLRLPYLVHEDTYVVAPNFLWNPLQPEPAYRHKALYDYHVHQFPDYYRLQRSSFANLAKVWLAKGRRLLEFFLGGLLLIPFVTLPWVLRAPWMRFALLTIVLLLMALAQLFGVWPHYAAPAAALLYALVTQGLRRLRLWGWHGPQTGRLLVRTITVLCLVSVPLSASPQLRLGAATWVPLQYRFREPIIAQLRQQGGQHLIVVRYTPDHRPWDEWVYNEADIDGAAVVWAREMDREHNRKLVEYFKGRRVWLLEVDADPDGQSVPRLVAYRLAGD